MRRNKLLILAIYLLFFFSLILIQNSYSEELTESTLKIKVCGNLLEFRILKDSSDVIYIPATDKKTSKLANFLGAFISYDSKSHTVVVTKGAKEAKIYIDKAEMEISGTKIELTNLPKLVNNIPYLPLEMFPRLFDAQLVFDEKERIYYFDPMISLIELTGEKDKYLFGIKATGPINYSYILLRQPERFVVDIPNAILVGPEREIDNPQIGKIRFSQFQTKPNIVRIVIPLDKGAEPEAKPRRLLSEISFDIKFPRVAGRVENFTQVKITKLEVNDLVNRVLIKIKATGPVQYQWHRLKEPDNRLFIDIPLSVLIGRQKEILLKNSFLEKVRIAQFKKEPEPVARIVLYLKKPVVFQIDTSLDIPNQLIAEVKSNLITYDPADYSGAGVTSFPAKGKIICIDPGHGGSDPGAMNRYLGVSEKEITLDIAKRLSNILLGLGYNVVLTRNSDEDLTYPLSPAKEELYARASVANNMKADIFVSIHCNAMYNRKKHGTSTHWYKKKDKLLAQVMQQTLVSQLKRKDRGIFRDRFYVLRVSRMPSVLVEAAFVSNKEECKLLKTPEFRQKIAEGIADGINNYFSITR